MFRNWLRRRRRIAGFSQETLAQKIGSPQSRVSEWERGTNFPAASIIPILASALGVKPETLEKKIEQSRPAAAAI